ncbi:MAG: ATP-binding protein [Actinomycetes bacterium]
MSQSFKRGPRAAAQARTMVTTSLDAWGLGELSRTAALLTSELVTNAVVHAHSSARVVVAVADGVVEVGVTDWDPHKPRLKPQRVPVTSPPSTAARSRAALPAGDVGPRPHGRGLLVVAELADAWGTVDIPAGKQVWFSLQAERWPYRTACACMGDDLERVRLGSGRVASAMPEPWEMPMP